MNDPIPPALRILGHLWLEEVRPDDLDTLTALPELAGALPATGPAALADLAVEYQRLFGFNLPPYESVFVDPSAMLLAPATARLQALYAQAGWLPPEVRVGAPDHVGLELLALADWLERGPAGLATRLHVSHLALWAPALIAALRRLAPLPFYDSLAGLTGDLLLAMLPAGLELPADPFPAGPSFGRQAEAGDEEEAGSLRNLVRHLLTPCRAGLWLSRADLASLGRAADLPGVVGERAVMLEGLFRLAGEYERLPALLDQLRLLLAGADSAYQAWAESYPAWTPYARAWQRRLAGSRELLETG